MVAIKYFSVASLMWLGLASYGLATHQENPRDLDKLGERQLDELEVRDLEERGRNFPTPGGSHGGGHRGGGKIVKRGRNFPTPSSGGGGLRRGGKKIVKRGRNFPTPSNGGGQRGGGKVQKP